MKKVAFSALLSLALFLSVAAVALAEQYVVNVIVDGKPITLLVNTEGTLASASSESPGVQVVSIEKVAPAASGAPAGATANRNANLRGGPGTSFAVVGSVRTGQALNVTGKNQAGDWLQLADGNWIAAFLVKNAPAALPVVETTVEQATQSAQPAPEQVSPTPPSAPAASGTANVVIQSIYYDGQVYRVESDEYAVIANIGTAPVNIGGWRLSAGDPGQDFRFPGFDLAPGQSVRVYTNESHPESGGFSFGSGRAVWNNSGDCGYLFDASGNQVAERCY